MDGGVDHMAGGEAGGADSCQDTFCVQLGPKLTAQVYTVILVVTGVPAAEYLLVRVLVQGVQGGESDLVVEGRLLHSAPQGEVAELGQLGQPPAVRPGQLNDHGLLQPRGLGQGLLYSGDSVQGSLDGKLRLLVAVKLFKVLDVV